MSPKNRSFILLIILLIVTLACTAPALSATPAAATTMPVPLVADTQPPAMDTLTPALSETETPSPLPTDSVAQPKELPSATPGDTATPITFPTVTFERNTNCRLGPLKNYFLQTSFIAGRYTFAEGRNEDSSWLLVKPFEGPNCWISISNLKDAGDYSYLPVSNFPPLPEAPFQMVLSKRDCSGRNLVILRWSDVTGETGYRIYREGIMLAALKENATEYQDYPPDAGSYFYEIEAVNAYGASVRFSMSVSGCQIQ